MTVSNISFSFLWYDLWIGVYFDRKKKDIYFCPLPCCVFKIELNHNFSNAPQKNCDCLMCQSARAAKQ